MSNVTIQASFNSGEWAPQLYARVDLQQYRSAAALLENYYVDYRGGASSRMGTKYVLTAFKPLTAVRLITFQASYNVGYILEFGDNYIRFYYQGSPILEAGVAITAASKSNPFVISVPGNTYAIGDWVFLSGLGGMTQANGQFYIIAGISGSFITLSNLQGGSVNATGYSTYTSGGTIQRVYTIASPYAAAELALVKFTQEISEMILCHPNHPPYVLSLISATNWSMLPAVIGTTITPPASVGFSSTLGPGQVTYAYGVTTIDSSGQESEMSTTAVSGKLLDIRVVNGSNIISWSGVSGQFGFNVYKAVVSYAGAPQPGAQYGFVGTTRANQFIDSNIAQDFSQTPPIPQNPFSGSGVAYLTITASSSYTAVPTVTLSGGSPSIPASATAQLGVGTAPGTQPTVAGGGTGYAIGDTAVFSNGIILQVASLSVSAVASWSTINPGVVASGAVPANPLSQLSTSGAGTGATINATWYLDQLTVQASGAGYQSAPTVIITGGATATATLGPSSAGNPEVPGFFQQRLVFAGQAGAPQTFYMSRPGTLFNFDISDPSQPDDAITGTLVSGVLNNIKAIVSSASGMLLLTDRASWLVNGGGSGTAVSPSTIVANAQSFVGCSDVPPIVANYDVLYVQSGGFAVRDLAFNIYFSVFTGEDISVLSSHLFFGYTITEWAYAEQPFYLIWAVRNDGVMLSLTFLKEQQFKGWAHHVTQGQFKSVATVTEPTATSGVVNALYCVVQRTINGLTTQYIERMAERVFPNGVVDAWCVDAGLQYIGTVTSSFVGAEHLAGAVVTGLADGQPITPFTMPASGQFTLPAPAAKVTIGLAMTAKLQSLPLQLEGQDVVQGKVKKTPFVDVRVKETLGLSIGSDFTKLTPMKDLIRGNVSSMLTGQSVQVVSDLVTGDARTFLDPTYTVPGQFCIQQSLPYPSSILGLFPSYAIGDDQ